MKAIRWAWLPLVLAAATWRSDSIATVVRAVPLPQLVDVSDWVVVATVTDVQSHYIEWGGGRRVVTDTTLQLDLPVTLDRSGASAGDELITVRTLGGTVGSVAHVVLGEATLPLGSMNLLFLHQGSDGYFRITGMAQGQYPVTVDDAGEMRIFGSSGLDTVTDFEESAVAVLSERTLEQALILVGDSAGVARMVQ